MTHSGSIPFDRAADFYDQTRGFPPGQEHKVAAFISRVGGLTARHRLLEIGVGTGRIALPLTSHVGAYWGIDISLPMMNRLLSKQNQENIHLLQADASHLPFAPHSFDAVIAVHVFHLIEGWQTALREVTRVLRPSSPLIHCWGGGDPLFQLLQQIEETLVPPHHRKENVGVPREHYTSFLESAGWRPLDQVHVYTYTYERIPQQIVEQIRRRVWSRTWHFDDQELEQYAEASREAIHRAYPNPHSPILVNATFSACAYLPPPA